MSKETKKYSLEQILNYTFGVALSLTFGKFCQVKKWVWVDDTNNNLEASSLQTLMYGRIYSDSSSTRRHYSVFSALSAFCLGNGDVCTMHTPELHDNIENKSFILTNEVRFLQVLR